MPFEPNSIRFNLESQSNAKVTSKVESQLQPTHKQVRACRRRVQLCFSLVRGDPSSELSCDSDAESGVNSVEISTGCFSQTNTVIHSHHHHHHHHQYICNVPITVKNEHKRYIYYRFRPYNDVSR